MTLDEALLVFRRMATGKKVTRNEVKDALRATEFSLVIDDPEVPKPKDKKRTIDLGKKRVISE